MGAQVYPVKILTALHTVMGAVGYVQKKGRNDFQKYNYAGEANLLEVLRPAMVEAGLLLIPCGESISTVDEFGNVFVTMHYTLAHKDGDVWPEKITMFGAGNDKNSKGGVGDKGLYKAITGANKYLLFKLFQIETGDDPEKESEHEKDAPAKVGSGKAPATPKPANGVPWTIKADSPQAFAKAFVEKMAKAPTLDAANKLHEDNKTNLQALSEEYYQTCATAYDAKVQQYSKQAAE